MTAAGLREATLARRLGVSRTPVRAALQHLVASGNPRAGTDRWLCGRADARPRRRNVGGRHRDRFAATVLFLRDIILSELEGRSESALMRRYAIGRGNSHGCSGASLRRVWPNPCPDEGGRC